VDDGMTIRAALADVPAGLALPAGAGPRVAIFTDESGWHVRELQRALRARGAASRCVDLADCRVDTTASWHGLVLPGFGAALPDAAIVRGIAGGTFEQVTHRLGILHALRELGVAVYNDARAIERSVDKAATSLRLHAAGLATPPTWSMESPALAQRLVTREGAAGHALVLKPLFGSQGRGVRRVGCVDGVHVPLPELAGELGALAYLQRFVPARTNPGHDVRVLVVGGRARAAMRRVGVDWVHNVARGARCLPQPLDTGPGPALAALAEAAAQTLGLDYAGVDLMPGGDADGAGVGDPLVIEVNGVAAWQGLQRVATIDIARALVDDLLDRRLAATAPRRRA
jgi:RimK family alpha-L-glutamate ligase